MRKRDLRRLQLLLAASLAAAICLLAGVESARSIGPNAIVDLPGCGDVTLPRNDDGSTAAVSLPFTANFFGTGYASLFVNNNGNVTFDDALGTFTPEPLVGNQAVIIAPFWADVDTRGLGSAEVTYGNTTFAGRDTFCVMWNHVGVGYFSGHTDKLNNFQLLLVDRSDRSVGDFDIHFNYDRILWETGDASGGVGGLGGDSARVGFSNGVDFNFELPGSAVNGAFLDSNADTGLIHNSLGSLSAGRYVFQVVNGATGGTGRIFGSVSDGTVGLGPGLVEVCPADGTPQCVNTVTNMAGGYSVSGLAPGDWLVRAFPPQGALNLPQTSGTVGLPAGTSVRVDLVLPGPQSPPTGSEITPSRIGGGGIRIVYYNEALQLVTTGCAVGTATYEIMLAGTIIRSGSMAEQPLGSGTYRAAVAPLFPNTGYATVTMRIDCQAPEPDEVDGFSIYIDPSGFIRTVAGTPIAGATVTLHRSDFAAGPFEVVPDGSVIMSPANRVNPDLTDPGGHFGWDVVAGFYRVRAEMEGCHAPGNASQPFVESATLTIPPPVTDLDLRLDCGEANVPPQATDDDASGTEDTDLTITQATLLTNDSDGDGDALSLTGVSSPTGGTVEISGADVVFRPAANLCGLDVASFVYTVSDGTDTDTATVLIDLACVADLRDVADALEALEDEYRGTSLADKIEDVLAKIDSAIRKLEANDAQGTLGDVEGALGDLDAVLAEGLPFSEVEGLIDESLDFAALAAADAILEAKARGGSDAKIDEAEAAVADGAAKRTAGRLKDAAAAYKDAVAKAQGA